MASKTENYDSIMIKRIYESEIANDKVYLVADRDKQKFPVHTVLLAAASEYFAASLGPNFQDGGKSEFLLEGTDGDTVKAIVDYCYTGEINLTRENVAKFLAIASSVQLDLLEAECRRFLESNLENNNCVNALMLADLYSYEDLRQKVFDTVCWNFNAVPSEDIQKLELRLLQELLKSDTLQATEELVFQRLLDWFYSKESDREEYMSELLKLIRLELITPQFISGTIEPVYERFGCHKLFCSEYKRRALNPCMNIGISRSGSIFCLYTQFKGKEGAVQSAIKVEEFNATLNSFAERNEIPLGDRTDFGVMLWRNKVFVLGGFINNQCSKSASVFDLNTGEQEILPDMKFARGYFTPILGGKYIYVFGGHNRSSKIQSCERFDIEAKTWNVIREMNIGRHVYGVSRLNENFCVAGDHPGSESVELYNPERDEWTLLAPMTVKRHSFGMTTVNEFLYAFGYDAAIERYDLVAKSWTKVESFEGSELVSGAITVLGNSYVIMKNGIFGRITINENGECSFIPIGSSKYKWLNYNRLHLYYSGM